MDLTKVIGGKHFMELRLKDFQNQCSAFKYNVETFLNKVAPVLNADPGSKSQLKELSKKGYYDNTEFNNFENKTINTKNLNKLTSKKTEDNSKVETERIVNSNNLFFSLIEQF